MNRDGLQWLADQPLSASGREQVSISLAMIKALDSQLVPIDKQLRALARRQPGCKALTAHDGIGPLTAVTILAELGDANRFSSSREAVRYAGLDITVHASDQRRAPWSPLPARTTRAALGAIRSSPMRPTAHLT